MSQMANNNFVVDDQLKGLTLLEHDDQGQAFLRNEAVKENGSISFANLFDYQGNQADLCREVVKESSSQGSFGGELGHILGLEERRSVHREGAAIFMTSKKKKRAVSFAPSCQVNQLVDNQTEAEGIEHKLWYSRYDFKLFEDEACLCSVMIQDSESQGTFDGELGHILGLEKIILCDSYFDRRDALRKAVMAEQAIQQMVKEIRSRKGCGLDDSKAEDISLVQLANTSERLSLWARDRAYIAAFTLEHDLAPGKLKPKDTSK